MRISFGLAAIAVLIGAGCTTAVAEAKRCYILDGDPAHTMLTVTYDPTATQDAYGDVPATVSITDDLSTEEQVVPGSLRNGERFVYPNGDYFEMVADTLVGHEPNLREGYAAMIDGLVATETTCVK